jgi:N-glycosylase/DNA lyase
MLVPSPFDLDLTVRSHGWYDLPPWQYDAERRVLGRPFRLSGGRVVYAEVAEWPGGLSFRALARGRLGAAEAREARAAMRRCLALDEDLGPFRRRAAELEALRAGGEGRNLPDLRWALSRGAGRLLRSPTVFEDAVKTLCTTNCSWSLTRAMVSKLCDALGQPGPGGGRAFPTPEGMAARPARFYREVIRAGYRAPFLASLARSVARGRLDLEALATSALSSDELALQVRSLDGFGPYASEHLLRLLGRHDHLALDSWSRTRVASLRGRRRPASDRTVARWYAPYGPWAGLAMWLEVTADWHGPAPAWP